jgi:acetoin utilization deacetylase AcuC-like enzyme
MTLLYADLIFLEHDTGAHPENANRLRAIVDRLEKAGLLQACPRGGFEPLSEDAVAQLHAPAMILKAKQTASQGGGFLDPDTIVSRRSFAVALEAAGACVAAVDAVLANGERQEPGAPCPGHRNALCLVRPPGHHATPERSMGFCLFNNIALAAQHARKRHGLSRILIVDWDVHHGNGTQDIFYGDPEISCFSIHRYGHGFYPGTGASDETGTGPGLGRTLNVPVRYGVSRNDYRDMFQRALERAADDVKPELVLVSAGFDAHANDPIGSLGLDAEDFVFLTQQVLQIARTHAGGRLVSCLEGGYDLDALAECVQAHLETLRG